MIKKNNNHKVYLVPIVIYYNYLMLNLLIFIPYI